MITTSIQIRFSDIDMLGHVNNIVLQQYYDIGKVQYFTDIVGMPPLWENEAFIAVNTNTNYYEEVRIDDLFHIRTKMSHIGTKSITFIQEIIDLSTQNVKSRSESVLVAFDLTKRVGIEIRPEWRDKIIAHETDIIIK